MDIQYTLYICFWNAKQKNCISERSMSWKKSTRVSSLVKQRLTLKSLACWLSKSYFRKFSSKVYVFFTFVDKPHCNSFQIKLVFSLFLQVASSTSPKPTGAKYKTLDWNNYMVNKWKLELWWSLAYHWPSFLPKT